MSEPNQDLLSSMTISQLEEMTLEELREMARDGGVTGHSRLKKHDLVMRLLQANAERQGHSFAAAF